MIEKIKNTPLYPILEEIYPRLHKVYIWLAWQICYLFPLYCGRMHPPEDSL